MCPAFQHTGAKMALTGMPDSAIVSPRQTTPGKLYEIQREPRIFACRPENYNGRGHKDEGLAC